MYKVWGFSELLPKQKIIEEKLLKIIRQSYESFGYTPIETPAVERNSVLTAKGGGEVKNQIFWLYGLANGVNDVKDYSLRFDLTVPFSRYILDYRGELVFPFKRSQIGKVWRGERSQRGRYKDFYQADIDAIWEENEKKDYLFYDGEVIFIALKTYEKIFNEFDLKADVKVNINNRKIITGFLSGLWLEEKIVEITNIIDKKDKISSEKFLSELEKLDIWKIEIEKILKLINFEASLENLWKLEDILEMQNEEFLKWISELKKVLEIIYGLGVKKEKIVINLSIVRGLAYYTGTVFETFLEWDRRLGSIGSGGRYEKLTSFIDIKTAFSGVGFSIGVTRMEDYLFENIDLENMSSTTSEYLVINFEETFSESLELYSKFASEGKKVEMFPEADKLWKQFKYADRKWIKYCIILWGEELKKGEYVLKNMKNWESENIKINK